ncbi:Ca(2+)-dependent cysteine protease [Kappamyces sp. JEL0680]|nr:Ca(2+)-dependent cysteine protease [Kappamyces sp. JEL0680]
MFKSLSDSLKNLNVEDMVNKAAPLLEKLGGDNARNAGPTTTVTELNHGPGGKRRALLVGINYFGSPAELRGCLKDVENMRAFLDEKRAFTEYRVLTDAPGRGAHETPTRQNMIEAFKWLVQDAQPNDSFFLHYSGHGAYQQDTSGDEDDGQDETLVPVDYELAGMIVDDEIHDLLVKPLPKGCKLTAVFDCCHSGSGMDLPFTYTIDGQNQILCRTNYKQALRDGLTALKALANKDHDSAFRGLKSAFESFKVGGKQQGTEAQEKILREKSSPAYILMFSGCKDNQTSADAHIDGSHTGAMSWALLKVLREDDNLPLNEVLRRTRDLLMGKYSQIPQMSTGHEINVALPNKMDDIISKIAVTGAAFVGKAAWSYAASVALKKVTTYVEQATAKPASQDDSQEDNTPELAAELQHLQQKLEKKLRIITPIIDQVELEVAQGKTNDMNATLALTDELKAALEALGKLGHKKLAQQVAEMKKMVDLVDELIPLLSLALQSRKATAAGLSGESRISFTRLLQASSALVTCDAQMLFADKDPSPSPSWVPVGPTFSVRLYSLFEGSARKTTTDYTWKEEFFKASCTIQRQVSKERQYSLVITQDLNDERYHDEVDLETVSGFVPGPSRTLPLLHISKMYYTSSGSLLNIEESLLPVLVLKISSRVDTPTTDATPGTSQKTEWIALELFRTDLFVDSDSEEDEQPLPDFKKKLQVSQEPEAAHEAGFGDGVPQLGQLCLLEYLIRLCCLEMSEGGSHTAVSDALFSHYFANTIQGADDSIAVIPTTAPSRPVATAVAASPLSTRRKGGLMERFVTGLSDHMVDMGVILTTASCCA